MKKILIILSLMFAFFVSNAQITANFTIDDPLCVGSTIGFTDASEGGIMTDWQWKVNGIIFANGSPNASYIFNTPGSYTIRLSVDSPPYSDFIDSVIVINSLPTVTLPAIDDVCENTVVSITENGGDATAWDWTPGDYTTQSIDPTMISTTQYTVVGTDIHGCENSASTMVTVYDLPEVDANTDQTICEASDVSLSGTITGDVTTGTWSTDGTGTFDNATALDAVYTPSSDDIIAGSVILTLTSDDPSGPCGTVSDDMTVTINPAVITNAGDDQTVCSDSDVQLDGSISEGLDGEWTTDGDGTFDDDTALDAVYTPSANDISTGSVTLTLTSDDPSGPCGVVIDDMTVTINSAVITNAGDDQTVCEGIIVTMSGSITGGIATGTWSTSGDGTFSDVNAMDANYTPGDDDIFNGLVTLTLTSDDPSGPCGVEDDALILTINPTYFIEETHEMCNGESYTWQGTTYTDAGTYYANYTTAITGCDSIYELTLTVNPTYLFESSEDICEGDSSIWRGTWYFDSGTYTDEYTTVNGCDSIYMFELTVNELPTLYTVITDPADGMLVEGEIGSVDMNWTDTDTEYYTTKGAAIFHGNTQGTGGALNLGDNYGPGTYEVWAVKTVSGCILKQETVTFIENTDVPKIIASASYGNDELSFTDNSVQMTLYQRTEDIGGEIVIIQIGEPQPVVGGNVEFPDLYPGEYYLKSTIVDGYEDVMPNWFFDGPTIEDAILIELGATDILVININHPMTDDPDGSNTIGGSIENIGGGKGDPMPDMVIIVRNEDTGDLIAVTISDENGEYFLEGIPDNENIQVYVTSFEHQNWTPANLTTGEGQHYDIDFVVDGDAVYPAVSSISNITKIQFSIYPNPASDFVNLDGVPDGAKIYVTSITGKMMLPDSEIHHNSLDISNLSSGIYLIIIVTENAMGVEKLIIK